MTAAVLVLNAGSSSIKFAVYPAGETDAEPLIRGKIEGIGRAPKFSARDADGRDLPAGAFQAIETDAGHETLTGRLLDRLGGDEHGFELAAAGHRVVHGGRDFTGPVRIDDEILQKLEALTPLAPLHQPHNLSAIHAIAARAPDLPQVACFDTSFHTTQPRLAQLFGLPRALSDDGILRYGFHGLSYDYIASVLPEHLGEKAEGRVLVAHLGNGASMCAMNGRRSIATSMGFTALDGLMMGRRCGRIDPGVILHLQQERGMTNEQVENLLYRESGLQGVSGISNSMQVLQESEDANAREAIDLFCYRAACEVGALTTALGGLDAIVFTAGIGENSDRARAGICSHLGWMGVTLDPARNAENAIRISGAHSRIDVLVIPTNEELVIARAVHMLTRS